MPRPGRTRMRKALTTTLTLTAVAALGLGLGPVGAITGLTSDTAVIGIDYRVQNGRLYGVGDKGGVYLINTRSAAATFVNKLSVPLVGNSFGVDFNPAADRLRIVSDTGQNLRHNVNEGGVTVREPRSWA